MSRSPDELCPSCCIYCKDVHGPEEFRGGHVPGDRRRHCCSDCYTSGGLNHHRGCKRVRFESVDGPILPAAKARPSSRRRSRSPVRTIRRGAPSPPPDSRCKPQLPPFRYFQQPVDQLPKEARYTVIVTMGLERNLGWRLLECNPFLKPYVTDVRDWLRHHDPAHHSNCKLQGTDPIVQRELMAQPAFVDAYCYALGHALSHEMTILGCKSGHHRSVALGELVAKHLECFAPGNEYIRLMHIDVLDEKLVATKKEIDWLLQWGPTSPTLLQP